jgi:proton glutamate symport protein
VTGGRRSVSLSVQITAALAAGLALGLAASAGGWPALSRVALGIEPIGTTWINLIRMVVIPLVAAALISGVSGFGGAGRLGRLGVRTLGFFWGTTVLAIVVGLVVGLATAPLAPLSAETAAALRSAATAAQGIATRPPHTPGLAEFLVSLVPANPFKAAADGALLPVIVFSVLVGAAVAMLDEPHRRVIRSLADAVVAAMVRLIGWFMVVAPIGVFCLTAPITARYGWEMLSSLAVFVAVVSGGLVLFVIVVFGPLAALLSPVRLGRLGRAIAPAATIGFSTTTSMAALPVMMETAERELEIPAPVASFVLPLGATINRPATGLYHVVAVVFLAAIYGIPLGAIKLAAVAATTFVMTLSVPAVPSGNLLALAPVLLAVGLPLDGIALLFGVDRIPDMFRTGTNVVGHMVAAAVVSRGEVVTPTGEK